MDMVKRLLVLTFCFGSNFSSLQDYILRGLRHVYEPTLESFVTRGRMLDHIRRIYEC